MNDYIYFIKDPQSKTIKIGKSNCPEYRMSILETELNKYIALYQLKPTQLKLLGVFPEYSGISEREVQKCFEHLHIGGEWFEEHHTIHEFVDSVCHYYIQDKEEQRIGSYKHRGFELGMPAYVYSNYADGRFACTYDSYIDSLGILHSSKQSFCRYYGLPQITKADLNRCVRNNQTLDHIFDVDIELGYDISKKKNKFSPEQWRLLSSLKMQNLHEYNKSRLATYSKKVQEYKARAGYRNLEDVWKELGKQPLPSHTTIKTTKIECNIKDNVEDDIDHSKEWFNTAEAASYLSMTPKSLLAHTSRGLVPFYKIGRRNRYKREELDEILFNSRK